MDMHTAQSLREIHGIAVERPRALSRIWQRLTDALLNRIAAIRAERRTINQLEKLDDRILEDIGVRRSEIRAVARGSRKRREKEWAAASARCYPALLYGAHGIYPLVQKDRRSWTKS
jgi:uncharacterized protein YjiS (DUF1127 family)